jgi:hypothetical protein
VGNIGYQAAAASNKRHVYGVAIQEANNPGMGYVLRVAEKIEKP